MVPSMTSVVRQAIYDDPETSVEDVVALCRSSGLRQDEKAIRQAVYNERSAYKKSVESGSVPSSKNPSPSAKSPTPTPKSSNPSGKAAPSPSPSPAPSPVPTMSSSPPGGPEEVLKLLTKVGETLDAFGEGPVDRVLALVAECGGVGVLVEYVEAVKRIRARS
jgi:hypothetical protein